MANTLRECGGINDVATFVQFFLGGGGTSGAHTPPPIEDVVVVVVVVVSKIDVDLDITDLDEEMVVLLVDTDEMLNL